MSTRLRILAAVVIGALVAAFLRRPVRPPDESGTWAPAERARSHR